MFDLKELGITQEDLQGKVVEAIAERMLYSESSDENGDSSVHASSFKQAISKAIEQKITEAVEAIAAKHVKPNLEAYIDGVKFGETNTWGERKQEPMTFREYLVKKAENYFTEQVDYNGKTNKEGVYSWSAHSTRVVHLIEKHLAYQIEEHMKKALAEANGRIVEGIRAAVNMKLGEIAAKLKTEIKV